MKEQRDYIEDIAEIRSIMERSSKFLSLSGGAGILAGLYALAGVWISFSVYEFKPDRIFYSSSVLPELMILAFLILILALVTAIYFSWRKSQNNGQKIWNATSRRLLINMAVPLISGGILLLIVVSKGLLGLVPSLMLLFYGLALYNAGNYTISVVKLMGFVQIVLGLLSAGFIEYGMFLWAVGFGVVHIIYGIYMHFRYQR